MSLRTFLGFLSITTLVTAATTAGCGGGVASTGGGGSGGGTGGGSSTTTGTGASSSSSSGTSTSSSGTSTSSSTSSSSSGPSCQDFTPPPPTKTPVTVRLVNKKTTNVFLGQTSPTCAVDLGFTLEDGAMKQLKPSRDVCEFTCEELQEGSCACPAGCAAPIVTLLAPNGHYDIGWPGTVFDSAQMPASCFMDPSCAQSACLIEKTPPAGPLTMKASAFSMPLGCADPNQCSCTPSPSGNCTVFNATTVGGAEVKAEVKWNGEGLVEITFM